MWECLFSSFDLSSVSLEAFLGSPVVSAPGHGRPCDMLLRSLFPLKMNLGSIEWTLLDCGVRLLRAYGSLASPGGAKEITEGRGTGVAGRESSWAEARSGDKSLVRVDVGPIEKRGEGLNLAFVETGGFGV